MFAAGRPRDYHYLEGLVAVPIDRMSSGIRATVTVSAPEGCPIARFSRARGTPIDRVSTSATGRGTASTTEFLADADAEADAEGDAVTGPLFSYGTTHVYRRSHDGGGDCPCECLGGFGCPVHRYTVEDGDVTLVFHAEDFEQLQAVMAEFRERFPDVDVRSLLQPPLSDSPEDEVFVDRGSLTDRQHEVLRLAYDRGYFERPKRANATELAAELGISQSTFTEHLVAAQRKLLGDVLD